ncbi:MAG: TPM domain-containing protein, partial [Clostridia bacterium]|nr:TPM domain-containing protein [Clostridia bacterium]
MKKRVLPCLLALGLAIALSLSAFALTDRVVDEAGLMTESELASLREKADALSEASGLDVTILTVRTTGGKIPQDYADDYYDEAGFGEDGVLFLWPVEERELTISTKGRGVEIFTDYGIEEIFDEVTPSFLDEDYAGGFDIYLDKAADFIEQADAGDPYDTWVPDPEPNPIVDPPAPQKKSVFSPCWLVISLVLGFLLGGIPLAGHKKAIQNVAMKTDASDSTRPGSFVLTNSNDVFMYQNVTRTPRASDSGSSSGGHTGGHSGGHSGGSSTHVSAV